MDPPPPPQTHTAFSHSLAHAAPHPHALGFLAQLRLFTQTNGWVLLAFAVGWGNALISLSFLLAALVKSKRTAIVLGYSTALVGTMCGVCGAPCGFRRGPGSRALL